VSFVELVRGATRGGHPTVTLRSPKEMTQMFTIEEESGTFTGSLRRHNGYYAGDFTRNPMCTPSELSALAKLRSPIFPTKSGNAD
jgi:hypothetical protein